MLKENKLYLCISSFDKLVQNPLQYIVSSYYHARWSHTVSMSSMSLLVGRGEGSRSMSAISDGIATYLDSDSEMKALALIFLKTSTSPPSLKVDVYLTFCYPRYGQ